MTKNSSRRNKFRKIGKAITQRGYDGDHQFSIGCKAVADKSLTSPTGPQMKTQQWTRTNCK